MTTELTDDDLMPIGIYKDWPLKVIPSDFLRKMYIVNYDGACKHQATPLNKYLHKRFNDRVNGTSSSKS